MGDQWEKFLAIPTSQKAALLVMMMGLMGAGWYFLFFEETQAKISAEKARTPKLNNDISEEKKRVKELAQFEAKLAVLKAKRQEMRDRLPDAAEIHALLQNIHSEAKVAGLDIARFEREDEIPQQMYARIPVSMILRGSFHQINEFLDNLSKMTRLVNVEDIGLKVIARERDKNILEASCTATTFKYLAPKKALPSKKRKKKKKKKKK